MQNRMVDPVQQAERILILDSLRGIAILGILLMNIPGFALPPGVYNNPATLNELGTIDYRTFYFIELIPDGTQRGIFSMLFGAGVILFVSRLEKKLPGLSPADFFFRRQLWLLVFGLFNGFVLLWFWDILFHYACFGMIIFTFRTVSPKGLIIAALACLVLMTVRENVDLYRDKRTIARGEHVAAVDTTVTRLTEKQKTYLSQMTELKDGSTIEANKKKADKAQQAVLGSYSELYDFQSNRTFNTEIYFSYYMAWDILLFMFLGMAFFKMGILTGQAPTRTYWILFLAGMTLGLFLNYFRLKGYIDANFNRFDRTKNIAFEYYELARSLRSVGLFGMIMLMYKSGWFKWFFALLRPVGQMAFTNYLGQSILCGLYFYGIGFGMFGKLQRHEIYYVVGTVWLIEIIWSHLWLRFFRFGPMEWAWRSLTYWKMQPLKKGE